MVGHHSRGLLQPVGNAARHVLVFSFFCSVEVWARVRVFGKESITATGKDMDRTKMGTTGVMEMYFLSENYAECSFSWLSDRLLMEGSGHWW